MSVCKQLKYIVFALLTTLLFVGCGGSSTVVHTIDDLDGSRIAVLNKAVSDDEFESTFPDSYIQHFKSSSEFLLALSIGKCDAGIVEQKQGELLLSKMADYVALSQEEIEGSIIIIHRNLLPNKKVDEEEVNLVDRYVDRIHRNIISDGYWRLILRGLTTTVTMFIMGIILAFALAITMMWMNTQPRMKYVSRPLSYFIKTIHDVPSVVLIFFFYYFVFATVNISGILVCAISLGVYSSGSLVNIFTVHLNQINKTQHAAAQMLGLTGWKKYRYVILPQAVKPMLPLLGAESKALLRATTYAAYISELDLVKVTEIIRNQTYDVLIPLLFVSAIFLILSQIIVESLSAIYNKVFKYD